MLLPVRGMPGRATERNLADIAALLLYLAIAILAIIGGLDRERTEAVLLTALVFVGFNVAWLFLFAPLTAKAPQGVQDPREPHEVRSA